MDTSARWAEHGKCGWWWYARAITFSDVIPEPAAWPRMTLEICPSHLQIMSAMFPSSTKCWKLFQVCNRQGRCNIQNCKLQISNYSSELRGCDLQDELLLPLGSLQHRRKQMKLAVFRPWISSTWWCMIVCVSLCALTSLNTDRWSTDDSEQLLVAGGPLNHYQTFRWQWGSL